MQYKQQEGWGHPIGCPNKSIGFDCQAKQLIKDVPKFFSGRML